MIAIWSFITNWYIPRRKQIVLAHKVNSYDKKTCSVCIKLIHTHIVCASGCVGVSFEYVGYIKVINYRQFRTHFYNMCFSVSCIFNLRFFLQTCWWASCILCSRCCCCCCRRFWSARKVSRPGAWMNHKENARKSDRERANNVWNTIGDVNFSRIQRLTFCWQMAEALCVRWTWRPRQQIKFNLFIVNNFYPYFVECIHINSVEWSATRKVVHINEIKVKQLTQRVSIASMTLASNYTIQSNSPI